MNKRKSVLRPGRDVQDVILPPGAAQETERERCHVNILLFNLYRNKASNIAKLVDVHGGNLKSSYTSISKVSVHWPYN
jgi:hypothetical protein